MRITLVRIRNFRSLVDVTLPFAPATVIVGENNTGKSAVVDALRFALSRGVGRRLQPSEYDFHMADPAADPRASDGISVEVRFSEDAPDEWPADLVGELLNVVQTNVAKDLKSVYLRYTYKYDTKTKGYAARWEFTNAKGEELKGKNVGGGTMMPVLLKYAPFFYLSALRDVTDEFGARSQFWGRLLRALEIPEKEQAEILKELGDINNRILAADPRLGRVTESLTQMQHVVGTATQDAVSVRALPLRIWDLLEKADVVLKAKGSNASLPLVRHGQGVQSLAVLFLFQAFVEHLLDGAGAGSKPLLALEEPEAHLHPQAARALWHRIDVLPGQKVVTSHSPFFVQHVPFRSVVVLRRAGPQTKGYWLPTSYQVAIDRNPALDAFVAANGPKYSYDNDLRFLDVKGAVTESEYRKMLACYVDQQTRADRHAALKSLFDRSQNYISDDELSQLETFARRMRGEILFSKAWLLCEGQSDYMIVHAFAKALGKPLDAEGVSVIDYQNSGNPGAFVALARALAFPWFMVCDDDKGGQDHVKQVKARGVSDAEIQQRVAMLPKTDMEGFLVERFVGDMAKIAGQMGFSTATPTTDAKFKVELADFLRARKTDYAYIFAAGAAKWGPGQVPDPFAAVLKSCVEAANV